MDKDKLLSDLKQAEGFDRQAYKDGEPPKSPNRHTQAGKGYWTAGYGHFLDQSKDWTGITFDQSTIDNWLSTDVDKALGGAQTLVEWSAMDFPARQNALVELVFNMGLGTWRGFVLTRQCLAHQQWQMAYDNLLDSRWAHEVQPDGFNKPGRATRIASYILRGEF